MELREESGEDGSGLLLEQLVGGSRWLMAECEWMGWDGMGWDGRRGLSGLILGSVARGKKQDDAVNSQIRLPERVKREMPH